jgi:hypothetical protein
MQEITAFSQVIATFLVAATLYVLWRQTRAIEENLRIAQNQIIDLQESRSRQQMYQVISSLSDIRDNIENVLKLEGKPFSDWSAEDKKAAFLVCARFHLAGIMVIEKMVPEELLAKIWFYSIPKSFEILKPYLEQMRIDRDPHIGVHLTFLHEKSLSIPKNSRGLPHETDFGRIHLWPGRLTVWR